MEYISLSGKEIQKQFVDLKLKTTFNNPFCDFNFSIKQLVDFLSSGLSDFKLSLKQGFFENNNRVYVREESEKIYKKHFDLYYNKLLKELDKNHLGTTFTLIIISRNKPFDTLHNVVFINYDNFLSYRDILCPKTLKIKPFETESKFIINDDFEKEFGLSSIGFNVNF